MYDTSISKEIAIYLKLSDSTDYDGIKQDKGQCVDCA